MGAVVEHKIALEGRGELTLAGLDELEVVLFESQEASLDDPVGDRSAAEDIVVGAEILHEARGLEGAVGAAHRVEEHLHALANDGEAGAEGRVNLVNNDAADLADGHLRGGGGGVGAAAAGGLVLLVGASLGVKLAVEVRVIVAADSLHSVESALILLVRSISALLLLLVLLSLAIVLGILAIAGTLTAALAAGAHGGEGGVLAADGVVHRGNGADEDVNVVIL